MKLLNYILINLCFYAILKAPGLLMGKPIPGSVISMYMFFIVITVLLVMTVTDRGVEALFAPLRALVEDPSKAILRNIVFIILPVAAGYIAYTQSGKASVPPVELRSAHPAPPAVFKAYGKEFDLSTLENPYRKMEKADPAAFKDLIEDGGEVYFKNCVFCHGAKLDGRGHYAHALDPLPMPFTGGDTIAQLQESYVFWRVVKGGPGLPREGGPSISSMPSWEGSLSEDEVWKVILFLYDYTGNRPRIW
ncbi:MAG TPA: hypothetical protein DDW94_05575 [Deltaproteobacteria bacterium]|nr:MAG: hypothetical protein A2Z79_04370 [Deltaproteobacteria bacterium GWA2_55_82]OGQ64159.1 MAG: hypothetical protein A3I81_10755 [Deltaproteobacteria bacterium RIFCSPLOWO2_02_FULL_55_12]OIJ74612.1 MAG: hypothetical protein A2V21_310280 [Deltaproteobacteria bacterium GWC2_55_46]HBG46444.1 hypothetical protein [Deltaproteobacteria bacterium]HCY10656.1 hypothetical protein [Deltaproteobacteria bacterium]